MKELLKQLAAYNIWATKLLADRIKQLSEEDINKEIASSFPSLYKTVLHMWDAESIWWQRLKLAEQIIIPNEVFKGKFDELAANLAKQSLQWKEWVENATDNQLAHVFSFVRNKEEIKMLVHNMLLHLFNHGTYHRGQLVTLLRQLNADKIPQTDFSVFCRKKN